jgi:hypothetical protein
MVKNSVGKKVLASSIGRRWSRIRLTREVDGSVVVSVHLVDHVLELRLAGVLAERAHDGAQLLGGDLTCATVLIRVDMVRGSRWESGLDSKERR